jgi:UDP-N-acetylmuramyl pentapeptide phosphotransferase/UDP-N-acetylglucosamine-1-phosphate transferase
MKPFVEFVKTTLMGGLLFLIPVVLVVLLVQKALHLADSGLLRSPTSCLCGVW